MTNKLVKLAIAMALSIAVWGCGDSPTTPSGGSQPTQQSQQTSPQPAQQSPETPTATTPPNEPAPPTNTPPGETPPTPPTSPNTPTTPTPTPPPPSNSTQSCFGLVSYETLDGVTWKFRNNAPYYCDALVAMWEMPVPYPQPGWSKQTKVDIKHMRVAPSQTDSLTLMLPGCGKLWQSDFYPGVTPQMAGPNGENIHPENLVYPNVTHRFGSTPACPPPSTPKVEWHQLAVCDVEPNEVEIRGLNLNSYEIRITGQLFLRPDGGTAKMISEVPPQYQVVPAGGRGGPEERVEKHYSSFTGVVYGWAEAHTMDGKLISREVMPETRMSCGAPAPKVEWSALAVCTLPDDVVKIKAHNSGVSEVRVTGQLYAKPDDGPEKMISEVPPAYQVVSAGGHGGPEDRIRNHYSYFKGVVYGWAKAHTMDGKFVSEYKMLATRLECGTPTPPPPPCSVTNPPGVWPTGKVVQTSNNADGARVTVSGTYRNIQGQYIGILWRNGNSKYVKDFKPLNAKCEDGTVSFQSMDWTSTHVDHLPSNGAKYYTILFTNGNRDNPDIIAGSETLIP